MPYPSSKCQSFWNDEVDEKINFSVSVSYLCRFISFEATLWIWFQWYATLFAGLKIPLEAFIIEMSYKWKYNL